MGTTWKGFLSADNHQTHAIVCMKLYEHPLGSAALSNWLNHLWWRGKIAPHNGANLKRCFLCESSSILCQIFASISSSTQRSNLLNYLSHLGWQGIDWVGCGCWVVFDRGSSVWNKSTTLISVESLKTSDEFGLKLNTWMDLKRPEIRLKTTTISLKQFSLLFHKVVFKPFWTQREWSGNNDSICQWTMADGPTVTPLPLSLCLFRLKPKSILIASTLLHILLLRYLDSPT